MVLGKFSCSYNLQNNYFLPFSAPTSSLRVTQLLTIKCIYKGNVCVWIYTYTRSYMWTGVYTSRYINIYTWVIYTVQEFRFSFLKI